MQICSQSESPIAFNSSSNNSRGISQILLTSFNQSSSPYTPSGVYPCSSSSVSFTLYAASSLECRSSTKCRAFDSEVTDSDSPSVTNCNPFSDFNSSMFIVLLPLNVVDYLIGNPINEGSRYGHSFAGLTAIHFVSLIFGVQPSELLLGCSQLCPFPLNVPLCLLYTS